MRSGYRGGDFPRAAADVKVRGCAFAVVGGEGRPPSRPAIQSSEPRVSLVVVFDTGSKTIDPRYSLLLTHPFLHPPPRPSRQGLEHTRVRS